MTRRAMTNERNKTQRTLRFRSPIAGTGPLRRPGPPSTVSSRLLPAAHGAEHVEHPQLPMIREDVEMSDPPDGVEPYNWAHGLSVACPTCRAIAGQRCRTHAGNFTAVPHAQRRIARDRRHLADPHITRRQSRWDQP